MNKVVEFLNANPVQYLAIGLSDHTLMISFSTYMQLVQVSWGRLSTIVISDDNRMSDFCFTTSIFRPLHPTVATEC